ncbi:MAG: antitoxin VbhA family protein [Candidatus Saccharimonas sp.]
MIKSTKARQKSVASAIGSVRAEGLAPSARTQARLLRYADGKISAQALRQQTLQQVRNTLSPSK